MPGRSAIPLMVALPAWYHIFNLEKKKHMVIIKKNNQKKESKREGKEKRERKREREREEEGKELG